MAVYTDVFISNLALGHIGIGQRISDLGASGHLSQVCAEFFEHAREEVLERYQWPITSKRVALGLVEEDPNTDWPFAYRYPVGCVAVRRLVPTSGLPETAAIPYELGQDATGRLIYTGQEDAIAEVSYWYTDPGEWPSYLAKATSWNLATYICGPLGKGSQRGDCVAGYENAITNATGLANREKANKPPPASSYVSSR